ncbi:MAG: ABC-type Mn2+/Zn2+ transport system ATPase subunit [Arenicella sp.]|jgi:ABC-type Mn2+/Zn2+ transport system ATPase subunit
MDSFEIKLENCNSIDQAEIDIEKGRLNIKYGPNGIGKSTIAKAIVSSCRNDGSIEALTPFKHRENPGQILPSVSGVDDIDTVLVFDEEYVSQFVFQQDEVVKDSFNIFLNTDEYQTALAEIEGLFAGIKSAFESNEELQQAISNLKQVRDAFGVTRTGAISKSSKGFKAFGTGNKIENVPPALSSFTDFIQSDQPAPWIAWQAKGNPFMELSDNCPYCSSSLEEDGKKETAKLVATELNSKSIEHLNAIQAVLDNLGQYFEEQCRANLEKITKSKIELSPEEVNFLGALRGDVDTLISKLGALQNISFFSLKDVEKIGEAVLGLKVELDLLPNLASDSTKNIVDPVNEKLDELVKQVGDLTGKVNMQKARIAKSIEKNQTQINGFLKSAGYKYGVEIQPEQETYKMRLVHQDFAEHIETAVEHLSYGERNAFALILFMHQVLSEKPDLVILDDPVSSFDKTKKFAILEQLFRGSGSLRDTTVLMLTHDIEPAIDVTKSVSRLFQHNKPAAFFLSSKSGTVGEVKLEASDLKTFAEICRENIANLNDEIIKCIYLRRHFELLGNTGYAYNLLSSLIHGKQIPTMRTSAGESDMTAEEIELATESIKEEFQDFDYDLILANVCDAEEIKTRFNDSDVGYEKIQLYRIFAELHETPDPANPRGGSFKKFINESFHIENEYVMQLNPHEYDMVPEYVVHECTNYICGVQS